MKISLLVIFIFSTLFISAQSSLSKVVPCYPYENKQADTLSLDGKTYFYKIMQTRSTFEDRKFKVLSEVIMPDFLADSDPILIQKVINKIGKRIGTTEFAVFNDCKAREYYYSCKDLLSYEYKYYKKHFVGYYKLSQ